jgi:hypothetical protein
MTHVNLDTQPEAVRRFVMEISATPDGAVLESAGRAVACVVRPPQGENGTSTSEDWSDAKNRRRCELIDRKYDSALSPAEEAELALLQETMYRHVDRLAPLPLDAARRLHQELLQKAAHSQTAQPE